MGGEGRPFRVFWPLDLTGPTLAGGGGGARTLYGFSHPGSARVAAAVVVAGALDGSGGGGGDGSADAERRLQSIAASLPVQAGEQLGVVGEWAAAAPAAGSGAGRQQQAVAGPRAQRSTRARRQQQQQQQQQHREEEEDEPASNGAGERRQRDSGVWMTAVGAAPQSPTGRPMACPPAPGAPPAGAAVLVPEFHVRWPGREGSRDVDVFLYAVPQPGRSHAPVLAAEAEAAAAAAEAAAAAAAEAAAAAAEAAAAEGAAAEAAAGRRAAKAAPPGSDWMGEGPGVTSLEWACHCINRVPLARRRLAGAPPPPAPAPHAPPPPAAPPSAAWPAAAEHARAAARRLAALCARGRPADADARSAPASAAALDASLLRAQDAATSELLQRAAGLAAAAALARRRGELAEGAAGAGAWLCSRVVAPNIDWLTGARPGGVKLHAELSLLLGAAASAALDAWRAAYAAAWPALGPAAAWSLAAAAALLGAAGGLAAAADALRLLLLPLEWAYVSLAALYRLHLRCLAAMWRLMRGRGAEDAATAAAGAVRLRLRRRAAGGGGGGRAAAGEAQLWGDAAARRRRGGGGAGDEVTAEHVIVGVLLFTPLLALLPTTAAWYLLALLLHAPGAAARATLLGAAAGAARNPACALARRALRPAAYPGELCVEVLLPSGGVGSERPPPAEAAQRAQHGQLNWGPRRQRCFLLGFQPLSYGRVLAEAWAAAPAAPRAAGGARQSVAEACAAWARAVLAGRTRPAV
ncbi:hypothetical protein Rsub_03842 [Raphidocelis subcapitata]|uniref:Uncharacterized protein n=1 Tax=Raphidocelis subcapitata TaxID=307507 RepID=A0A2V0P1B6_9CHLO|nr:hypothetical protein Rsub_03842 [Raphidocelis subcapitata]|eukprot:GBF90987.1 hypothetical protein Rsub_03842 [Raphidocelis subcapitata]